MNRRLKCQRAAAPYLAVCAHRMHLQPASNHYLINRIELGVWRDIRSLNLFFMTPSEESLYLSFWVERTGQKLQQKPSFHMGLCLLHPYVCIFLCMSAQNAMVFIVSSHFWRWTGLHWLIILSIMAGQYLKKLVSFCQFLIAMYASLCFGDLDDMYRFY